MQKKVLEVKFGKQLAQIPFLLFEGPFEGPTIFISGGIHGDEVNGIELIYRIISYFEENRIESTLKGKIYVVPVLNPIAFKSMSRFTPLDGKDLNRVFGKSPESLTDAIATKLESEIFSKCDYGIDIHDSGQNAVLLPHVRIHKLDSSDTTNATCTKELAQAFGTKVLFERDGEKGMLAIEMNKTYGVQILTVEIGGAQRLYNKSIEVGLQGVLNVLFYLKILEGKIITPKEQFVLRKRFGVIADDAAITEVSKKLGQRIDVGEKVGWAYYPHKQQRIDLISPVCGILFSKWVVNQIIQGKYIYTVLDVDECKLQKGKTEYLELLKRFEVDRINN